MQKVKIPAKLDPVRSAVKKLSYVGVVTLSELPRLADMLIDESGAVDVTLECDTDEQGMVVLRGHLHADFSVACQRCSGPMALPLDCEFIYSPVRSDEEYELLPEAYEPVEVDEEGEIDLHGLIEDELIVAIPQVPRHAQEDCLISADEMSWGEIADESERPNPFAILETLKRK